MSWGHPRWGRGQLGVTAVRFVPAAARSWAHLEHILWLWGLLVPCVYPTLLLRGCACPMVVVQTRQNQIPKRDGTDGLWEHYDAKWHAPVGLLRPQGSRLSSDLTSQMLLCAATSLGPGVGPGPTLRCSAIAVPPGAEPGGEAVKDAHASRNFWTGPNPWFLPFGKKNHSCSNKEHGEHITLVHQNLHADYPWVHFLKSFWCLRSPLKSCGLKGQYRRRGDLWTFSVPD